MNLGEIAGYLVLGGLIVLTITYLGLRRDDNQFKKMFAFDIHAPDSERRIRAEIQELAKFIADKPTSEDIEKLLVLLSAARYKGFLKKWK